MDQKADDIGPPSNPRPRLLDWIWRPWYARLWWASAAVFWTAAALDAFVLNFVPIDHTDIRLIYLFVALFHPFVIVPVLSFGFVWAWIRFIAQETQPGHASERSFKGSNGLYPDLLDPTNPLDPRFITHPANPLSPASRERRLWKHN